MGQATILTLIFLGGGLGSLSRYLTGVLALRFYKGEFPLGTLLANFLACLVLGLTIYLLKSKVQQSDWMKYFLIIGFCGGFSTFSTFSLETLKLFQDQHYLLAILNILISLVLGIGILWSLIR